MVDTLMLVLDKDEEAWLEFGQIIKQQYRTPLIMATKDDREGELGDREGEPRKNILE